MRAFILGVLAALILAAGAWYALEELGLKQTTAQMTASESVRLD